MTPPHSNPRSAYRFQHQTVPGESNDHYERLAEPRQCNHRHDERAIPISQGSPPRHTPYNMPVPVYYRDYLNPHVYRAYYFICHSAWYVQVSIDVILCAQCAISEHSFCISNRPIAVWRNLHLISRTFQHTQLHCGRCYKLLIQTQRAID